MTLVGQWVRVAVTSAVCIAGAATPSFAQPGRTERPAPVPQVLVADSRNANELRNDLRELMQRYPPALGRVLRLDPTLLSNDAYLTPYPELRQFLTAHPEIARTPEYFLSFVNQSYESGPVQTVEQQRFSFIRNLLEMLAVVTIGVSITLVVLWLVRHLLAHRRWLRATKIQTDIHNRLMERLSSSEDVKNYLESAATSQLLADVPTMLHAGKASSVGGRIILAVQVGIVLASGGAGLLLIKSLINATEAAADSLVFFGVLLLALGVGFALSAGASYTLSNRLGLIDDATSRRAEDERA